ncbi:diguanylate cyclase [Algibacillus agarilyticus]|uniref:diguanylate cyclase n=1 Tax=Algibacillus agarilyticus TaxID=2234133 RepID=UPI000DCF8125|nr:diguanylate cyclase [Algibacillus agarilyticus]
MTKKPGYSATLVLLLLTYLVAMNVKAASESVIINKKSNTKGVYMTGLLTLALSYSHREYQIESTDQVYSKSKVLESMKTGAISLTWGGTSDQMEANYIPIRIDTYRGLMSHRLMLIREGEQAIFSQIKNTEDLKLIRFGQGRKWMDAKILEAAGMQVIKTNKKRNLYYMLDGDRFDAFPRGASEALTELSSYSDLPLTVEKDLVIVYPLPTYFFVSKAYPKLAADIEAGLETMLVDGQFDDYFYNSPEIKATLEQADLKNRRAIRLTNPYLPKATPLQRKELWLNLTKAEPIEASS